MPIKFLRRALIAALIITDSSSMAIADPAPSATKTQSYQLKAGAAFDNEAYQLEDQFRQTKDASPSAKDDIAVLASSSSTVNPVAIFTRSDKLADQPFSREIALAAAAASLDPALVHAVIFVESHYRQNAVSPKGAIGLMQVLPDTAARYGIKDPSRSAKVNIKAGTLYLRDLLRMFDNRMDLALAAYNAGEGAVLRYSGKIPPYRETQMYVRAVLAKYKEWQAEEPSGHQLKSDAVTTALDDAVKIKPHVEYLAGTRLSLSHSQPSTNY